MHFGEAASYGLGWSSVTLAPEVPAQWPLLLCESLCPHASGSGVSQEPRTASSIDSFSDSRSLSLWAGLQLKMKRFFLSPRLWGYHSPPSRTHGCKRASSEVDVSVVV